MRMAGRDQHPAGAHPHMILGHLTRPPSKHRKLRREIAHERCRQMLGHQDRDLEARRDRAQHLAERMDAAGRRPDRNNIEFLRHRKRDQVRPDRIMGAVGETVQPLFQRIGELARKAAHARFDQRVGGTQRQGLDGGRSTAFGGRGHDQNLCPLPRNQQIGQASQAMYPGHFEIEQDHIRAI
jgi:hypothetical protein